MKNNLLYPFSAIVGQEQVKKALILNLIEPAIGGVLLSGEKGTAKSTIVRSISSLTDKSVVTVPLNVTEDRLIGSIQLEHALKTGEIAFESGLLKTAHQQILYVDEVNLLSNSLTNVLLDAAALHKNVVQREGLSHEHASQFVLIGSMNPEEGYLKSQLLDRFGFFVEVKGSMVMAERIEVMKRRLDYETNRQSFIQSFETEEQVLRQLIFESKKRYSLVELSDEIKVLISRLCQEAFVAGHRGDITMTLAAKAHAAYLGRASVTIKDVEEVASLVLPHRMRETPMEIAPEMDTPSSSNHDIEEPTSSSNEHDVEEAPLSSNESSTSPESNESSTESSEAPEGIDEDEHFHIDESFVAKDILNNLVRKSLKVQGAGRRNKTRSDTHKGRYIKHKQTKRKVRDVAFDATIRQAAPFQNHRIKDGLLIKIHKEDIREKVREDRVGNMILFLVDASGSMGLNQRMSVAKGAVFSLLQDAYQKRDVVGMMTFRGKDATVILEPTRSIDLAYKKLEEIETGGRTPLSLGLEKSVAFVKSKRAKNKHIVSIVIIISDGRGNVNLTGSSFIDELKEISENASHEHIEFIVVDSETGFLKLGLAKTMAEHLKGMYLSLEELREGELVEAIKQIR